MAWSEDGDVTTVAWAVGPGFMPEDYASRAVSANICTRRRIAGTENENSPRRGGLF
ncbi:Hypothetical Protein XCAW_04085 [Xanthomonas citri subsp. citri Aw12879]|nr:Hypothetical Protein XCAW_04085 [Xanthomonas citri subsp. citri Aw12879]